MSVISWNSASPERQPPQASGGCLVEPLRRVCDELTAGQENAPLVYRRVKYDGIVARLTRRHPAGRQPVANRVVVVARWRESVLPGRKRGARTIAVDAGSGVTNWYPL